MSRLLLAFLLALPCVCRAQAYHIEGFIMDSFTKEKLDSVHITLMDKDSTFVEEFDAKPLGWWQSYQDIARPGLYIMKFTRRGYEDAYKTVHFRYQKYRRTGGSFGEVLMRKLPHRSVSLPEVTVRATKIKMVMKGDTVVYNADAFQLAEGSMLDDLLKRLPGMRLEPGGEIFMNGEKVQSLLVNGEEFFHGNPKVALDNLSAYMVDKVKVYGKLSEQLVTLGTDPHTEGRKLPLVVDVNLKREYSVGLVGNMAMGIGTSGHDEARLFALRFTDRWRLAVVANSNDIRGDSYYDSSGQWQTLGSIDGNVTTHEARTDMLYTDAQKKWKLSNNANWKWKRRVGEEKQSSVTFADADESVFSRHRSSTNRRTWAFSLTGTNSFTPKRGSYFEVKPDISYANAHNGQQELSADYRRQLTEHYMGEALDSLFDVGSGERWRRNLLSSLSCNTRSQWHRWHIGGDGKATVKYLIDDRLNVSLGGYYERERSWSLYGSANAWGDDCQARYSEHPMSSYKYYAQAGYVYSLDMPKLVLLLQPHYKLTQTYNSDHRPYYLLENTGKEGWSIDRLLSSKDSIATLMDDANTYYSRLWSHKHDMGIEVTMRFKGSWTEHGDMALDFDIPLRHQRDRLHYDRTATDTVARRDKWFFVPNTEFSYNHNNDRVERHFRLGYDYDITVPSMTWLINYRDDATPLVVRYGNPHLANQHNHHAYTSYRRFAHKARNKMLWNVAIDWRVWQDMLCQGMTYDDATGVRTYRPSTIDGNWELAGQFGFGTRLWGRDYLSLNGRTTASFRNSDDLISLSGTTSSVRSGVRRTLTTQRIGLNYNRGKGAVSLTGSLTWNHSESDRYKTMDAIDFNYGVDADIVFPSGLTLTSHLRMYSRRGYSDERFNTDQLIWNASLRKSFFKGKLRLSLEGFDLLDKLSEYGYTIDAQMQRETWRNVLRRYVLATVTWRFSAGWRHAH